MRSRLLASAAVVAGLGLAAPAVAADLSGRYPAPYVQPVAAFSWTGFYIGGNAGYGWGSTDYGDPGGFTAGVQAGYNYQFASPFVLGVEADINYSGMSGTGIGLGYFGTIRARAGWSFDRVLVYGTGGFAYGQTDANFFGLTSSANPTGWTLGLGGEYAVDRNWSARLEYLYVDLGSATYGTLAGPIVSGLNTNILRVGVNYRF